MKQRKDGRFVKLITINGKRKAFYSSEATEKKALKDIEKQLIQYSESAYNKTLFPRVAEEWYSFHCEKISESTRQRYKGLYKRCAEYFKNKYIKDITPKDINIFLNSLTLQNFSTKTIRFTYSILCLIFKYAYINQYIDSNPCQYIEVPKGKPSIKREALTEEEQKIVINSIDKTFGFFAYFLLYTGLRRGEAIAIKYSDIDFENKIIYVTRSAVYPDNTPTIKSPKTEAGKRRVVLLDCLAEKLLEKPHKADDYIFGDIKGNSWYRRRWEDYQKETGLTITPHQLRHTFATILFEANISEKDAQHILGHADIATTRNTYTHIRNSHLENTALTLNNFVNRTS